GQPANFSAGYDTTQSGNGGWFSLGDGLDSAVEALENDGSVLAVGGFFSQAGGSPANRVALFDTTLGGNAGWSALGDGVGGGVFALEWMGDDLYVGGDFINAGGLPASCVAVYDTTQSGNAGWSALGDGLVDAGPSGTCRVWALEANGTRLFAGGRFTEAGGLAAGNLATFDTEQVGNAAWSVPGEGSDDIVRDLQSVGETLFAGGDFFTVGGRVNAYLARYGLNRPPDARDDDLIMIEDQQLSGNVFDDNGNGIDSDPDGDPITVQSPGSFTANGIGGTVDLSANGDFTYTPPPGVAGTASFSYTIADPSDATDTATVTIIVRPLTVFEDRFEGSPP
ncbi:MAG: Ig-like domain-containing protein, partial [Pseudomonadota bacterium]